MTRYGGGTTDYVQDGNGVPIHSTDMNVYLDEPATMPLTTGMHDLDGNPITVVRTDIKGYYEWDSDTDGDLFLRAVSDPTGPTFRVHPANLTDRLVAVEGAVAAGGGTVGAVASVAGRQGNVVLDSSDIADLDDILGLKADLNGGVVPVAQLPQKYAAMVQQVGPATVGVMTPGGIPFQYPTTPAFLVVNTSRAPRGSSIIVTYYEKKHADQTYTAPVTVTIPVRGRSAFIALTGPARAAQDKWYAEITQVGSSEPGGDVTVQVLGVGSVAPPAPLAAPNPPTGLTVVNTTTTSNTVSWVAPAAGAPVGSYTLYRTPAGGSIAFVASIKAGTTSFLDTGLTAGTSYTYTLVAANDDAVSTDVVSSQYQYMSSASLAADWAVFVGSSPGASATQTGNTFAVVTGNVGGSGSGNAQDVIRLVFKPGGVTTTNSAVRVTFPVQFAEALDAMNILLRATPITSVSSALTNFVQIQMGPASYRVGIKAAGYNGGSFFNVTSSATTPAQATTVSGSTAGTVAWSIPGGMTLNAKYYVTAELLPVGTGGAAAGKQLLNIYLSTATGSPVLQNTITLDATQVAALASGVTALEFLGLQSTTGSSLHDSLPTNGSDMTVAPLAA